MKLAPRPVEGDGADRDALTLACCGEVELELGRNALPHCLRCLLPIQHSNRIVAVRMKRNHADRTSFIPQISTVQISTCPRSLHISKVQRTWLLTRSTTDDSRSSNEHSFSKADTNEAHARESVAVITPRITPTNPLFVTDATQICVTEQGSHSAVMLGW